MRDHEHAVLRDGEIGLERRHPDGKRALERERACSRARGRACRDVPGGRRRAAAARRQQAMQARDQPRASSLQPALHPRMLEHLAVDDELRDAARPARRRCSSIPSTPCCGSTRRSSTANAASRSRCPSQAGGSRDRRAPARTRRAPRPRFAPGASASMSAGSSTTGPRDTLMKYAVGFMSANSAAPTRWNVSSFSSGMVTTKSDSRSSVGMPTFLAPT